MTEQLAFRLLGPWQAQLGTTPLPVPSGRLRSLLASLLLADGEPLSIETLAEQVWPQHRPAKVRATLHTYVARLRQVVGHERLLSTSGGYRLIASADLHQFQALLAEARQQTGDNELELLRAALGLWRGRPFADASSTWLDQEVVPRLTDQWLTATERRIELELADGPALVDELTELTRLHPTRESLAAHLITALHRTGQRAEALRAFRRIRDALRAELGVAPGAELLALQRAVLIEGVPRTPPVSLIQRGPHRLPPAVLGFTGRYDELAALDVLPDTGVIAIDGAAGIGKSALALYWTADRRPGLQLHLDLRGHGPGEPVEPAAAMAILLQTLGVTSDRVPAPLDERVDLLKSELANRHAVIVLDNARDTEQVVPLLPGGDTLVLITSRTPLDLRGAQRLTLGPLPPEQAVDLLAATPPATATALCRTYGGVPLALVIAEATGTAGNSVEDAVAAAVGRLGPEAGEMFGLLAIHPAPGISLRAAAALADVPLDRARNALDELEAARLVSRLQPDRYGLHPLVRACAGSPPADAVRRLLDWYLRSAANAGQEWLEREFDGVRLVAEWAASNGYPGFTWRIALELSTYVDRVLPWREAVEFYALALEAARTDGEPAGEACLLNALGCLHLVMDERLMAASYFEQALACFRQQNDQAGQELLHANLALVHAELGDGERADYHGRQASGRAYAADGEVWGRIGA